MKVLATSETGTSLKGDSVESGESAIDASNKDHDCPFSARNIDMGQLTDLVVDVAPEFFRKILATSSSCRPEKGSKTPFVYSSLVRLPDIIGVGQTGHDRRPDRRNVDVFQVFHAKNYLMRENKGCVHSVNVRDFQVAVKQKF